MSDPADLRESHRNPAGIRDQLNHLARIGLLGRQVIDGNVCALAPIGNRSGAAHARVTPRDERLASLKAAGAPVTELAMVRFRDHLPGQPRPGLRLLGKRRPGIFRARIVFCISHRLPPVFRGQ